MLAQRIEDLADPDGALDAIVADAFALLEKTVRDDFGFATEPDRALKSYALDEAISKALHTRAARTRP